MNNDEKVKTILESEPVPQELEPENIKKMLDEKAPKKKRSGISVAGRVAAAAAAVAVIAGGSTAYLSRKPDNSKKTVVPEKVSETQTETTTAAKNEEKQLKPYMSGASDYSEVYSVFKKAADKAEKESRSYNDDYVYGVMENGFIEEAVADEEAATAAPQTDNADYSFSDSSELKSAEGYDDRTYGSDKDEPIYIPETQPETSPVETAPTETAAEIITETTTAVITDNRSTETVTESATETATTSTTTTTPQKSGKEHDYYETYNQEAGVLEADIAKTDGEYIYYVSNGLEPTLRAAAAEDGKFTDSSSLVLTDYLDSFCDFGNSKSVFVNDMYLYNDMLAVIGTVNIYSDTQYESREGSFFYDESCTYVAFFTKGAEPKLIDIYYQDGNYNDVRIAPDGFMYLTTNYSSVSFSDIENAEKYEYYIPECGLTDDFGCISPEDILLPDDNPTASYSMFYSIIGSIDLNDAENPVPCDTKALADYAGTIYSSENNIYAASTDQQTSVTRIEIDHGSMTPMASCTFDGFINDQFSMSEYDGCFRVAVTCDTYDKVYEGGIIDRILGRGYSYSTHERDNKLYVFDMDLNQIGILEGFGIDESIKSVSFQGNMAYVVTYVQTDPLFAIDLSDPTAPTILDEFKINGFSTYLQQWSDGLLFGFGIDADGNAVTTGVKMVMFDNSDPENLKEVGFYSINNTDNEYISSSATYERKALLLSPQRNLIAFPININYYDYEYNKTYTTGFEFFSYENGNFNKLGEFMVDNPEYDDNKSVYRALYIDDYMYVLSASKFYSLNMNDFELYDEVDFNAAKQVEIEDTTTSEPTTELVAIPD